MFPISVCLPVDLDLFIWIKPVYGSSVSGISLQNTLPEMDPAENTHLQAMVARQGAIIRTYQEQLANKQLQQPQPTQPTLATNK